MAISVNTGSPAREASGVVARFFPSGISVADGLVYTPRAPLFRRLLVVTGEDIFISVAALAGLGFSAGFWIPILQAIRKGEFRQAPRGSRRDTWLMVAGLAMTLSFGSLAYVEWQDPWHLYDNPRLSIDNAHGWALALAFSSIIPLGLVFLFAGCYGKLTSRSDLPDPSHFWEDIPPASRAECQVLLEQLKDDALWAKGNEAVAAYLHNVMLRNANSDDEWDSDEPLWEALQPELARRFSTREQREAAAEAIQNEYIRLLEEVP